jgi:carbamoyl-phosphate synthase small subunit
MKKRALAQQEQEPSRFRLTGISVASSAGKTGDPQPIPTYRRNRRVGLTINFLCGNTIRPIETEQMAQPAKLALEDGTVYTGISIGATGEVDGEVCFNTSMTGYQEILTDPSYHGQIVTMTYPQIGNYGVNQSDLESDRPHLSGFVAREFSRVASNFRSTGTLGEYLEEWGVVAIESIDTRALVKRIRTRGALRGILSTLDLNDASLVAKAQASPGLVGRDLVQEVMPKLPCHWQEPLSEWAQLKAENVKRKAELKERKLRSPHVVALDFGMKWNIPRHLVDMGCQVTILPGNATAEEVLAQQPDGVFLSNGPGDPEPLGYAIQSIQGLLGKQPIFGICLGHQLLALACGAQTFKMKFGHRGANQPVQNLDNQAVEITSQNHGFSVQEEHLPDTLEVTHRNLNDQTIEGLRHRELPAFSVQYHPEASAGPHDSQYLFRQFYESMVE